MAAAYEPGALRRLRADFAQALVEHDHLHEALDQFDKALEEPGEVPTAREIERHIRRIEKVLAQDELDRLLDRAIASPDQAVASLIDARELLAKQPSARSTRLRDASWVEKANAALVEPQAHRALAMLLGDTTLRAGRFEEAHRWYRQSVHVEPDSEAVLGAAEAAYLAGQVDAATTYLEELTDSSSRARLLRAQVLHALGDHEEAAELTDELLAESPDEPPVGLLRGSIALALAQPDEAEQAAESVLRGDPSHPGALGLLTQAHCAQYHWREATAAAVKVFRIDPTGFDTLAVRAQALLERGADPQAWAEPTADTADPVDAADRAGTAATAGRASIAEAVGLVRELAASTWSGDLPLVLARALAGRPFDADLNFLAASFLVARLQTEPDATVDHAARLDRARASLGLAETSQAGAWVHDLTARLLDVEGDAEGAFDARVRAAEQMQAEEDHAGALKLLDGLGPSSPDDVARVGFLVAYSVLALAWATTPVDPEFVGRGVEAWQRVFATADPPAGWEWVYVTYAHLLALAADRSPLAGDEQRRESVAYFELGVLTQPERADSWSRLSQGHRALGTWSLALEAVEQAINILGPDASTDWYTLDQLVATHASLDHRAETRELITTYLENASHDSTVHLGLVKSVGAFLDVADRRHEQAEAVLTELLQDDPLDRWSLMMRSDNRRFVGDEAGSLADLAAVTRLPDFDPEGADRLDAAWIAFWTGEPARAVELVEQAEAAGSRERNALQSLFELKGAALVASGRLEEGETSLARSLLLADLPRMIQDRLPLFLQELLRTSSDPAVAALVARIEQAAAERVEVLRASPPSADTDLQNLRETEGSPGFRAWGQAAADLATIRRALSAGDLELAEATMEEAGARSWLDDQQQRMVQIGVRAAFHALALGSVQAAVASADLADPSTAIAALDKWLPLLDDADVLEVWADESVPLSALAAVDELVRAMDGAPERADSLHRGLLQVLGDRLGAGVLCGPTITHPLALRLGGDVIPEDTSNEGWVLFTEYLPEVRQRIEQDSGVPLPGVNVREDPAPDRFAVLIDEVEHDCGDLLPGWGFVALPPDELGDLPSDAVLPMVDPISGAAAARVRHDAWDLLPADALALEDPVALAVRHLEGVVRRHLGHFVYPDVVRNILVGDDELVSHHLDGPMIRRLTELAAAAVDDGRSMRHLDQAALLLASNPDASDEELLDRLDRADPLGAGT